MTSLATNPRWYLKRPALKRFQAKHPWVYANELVTVKGVEVGACVDLYLEGGDYLASGFANPHSLIAFRVLDTQKQSFDDKYFLEKLKKARCQRNTLGLRGSRRLVHGEADGFSGLIIDEFYLCHENSLKEGFFLSIHLNSAGIDKFWTDHDLSKTLSALYDSTENFLGAVLRRDSSSRVLESLPEKECEFVAGIQEIDATFLKSQSIRVDLGELTDFQVDLFDGQKGGFFLDQRRNLASMTSLLTHATQLDASYKILDLFSYCGQWGIGLGLDAQLKKRRNVEVVFADASESALSLAASTAKKYELNHECVQLDLVEKEWAWPENYFDRVVCDPPALIKSKKHYFAGKRAYLKVMTRAARTLKRGGVMLGSSCSYHLSREDLRDLLAEISAKEPFQLKIIGEASLPPDHMGLAEFPEGQYLKGYFLLKI